MRGVLLKILFGVIAALPVMLGSSARAQAFIGGTPTAFTPQISIVYSGSVSDIQATVSADRKYVTLTERTQISSLLALRSFTFQQGNAAFGYVGMPETARGNDPSATAVRSNSQAIPWVSARPAVSILQRQGMIKVSKASTTAPVTPGPGNATK